jgi:hypothetical protein
VYEGLRNRQQWARTVRAAAGMRAHCEAVLTEARTHVARVLAAEPQLTAAKRWPPGMRKAMQKAVALQQQAVGPCESAELFLAFQGKQPGFFPHVAGLGRFFATAADALADRPSVPSLALVKRLKSELAQWDELQQCRAESKIRTVLGVIVHAPIWYLPDEPVPAFHGTAADAWVWLTGWPGAKKPATVAKRGAS